jgi:hypothetical protein
MNRPPLSASRRSQFCYRNPHQASKTRQDETHGRPLSIAVPQDPAGAVNKTPQGGASSPTLATIRSPDTVWRTAPPRGLKTIDRQELLPVPPPLPLRAWRHLPYNLYHRLYRYDRRQAFQLA